MIQIIIAISTRVCIHGSLKTNHYFVLQKLVRVILFELWVWGFIAIFPIYVPATQHTQLTL